MKTYLAFFLAFLTPVLALSGGVQEQWTLEKSEISYVVTHPLHVVHGKSLSAKGKGVCYGGHCDFLVAVPVKSFDSGDNNRDLHMLEVTKAGLYPMIEVKASTAAIHDNPKPKTVVADVEIGFAGKKVKYPKIQLDVLEWGAGEAHLTGNIPLSLKDFEITPPSLLTMPIHDEVPVKLDMFWKKMGSK
jgi:hypothetical protein